MYCVVVFVTQRPVGESLVLWRNGAGKGTVKRVGGAFWIERAVVQRPRGGEGGSQVRGHQGCEGGTEEGGKGTGTYSPSSLSFISLLLFTHITCGLGLKDGTRASKSSHPLGGHASSGDPHLQDTPLTSACFPRSTPARPCPGGTHSFIQTWCPRPLKMFLF